MKGVIQEDHIPLNNFRLTVPGLPDFVFTAVTGLEEELDVTQLPDRTVASGGRTNTVEFDVMLPLHHVAEQLAMELWFRESQDPAPPTYRKVGTLVLPTLSGQGERSFTLVGLFPRRRTLPDFEMENEGEMAAATWGMVASEIIPLGI